MSRIAAGFVALSVLLATAHGGAQAQQQPLPLPLNPGDAVVSGFSGTLPPAPPRPMPPGKTLADYTFIDPDGAAAAIVDISRPGRPWDASVLQAPRPFAVKAGQVGQIFGVAIGDQPRPDLYLAATSAYGLQIVRRGAGGALERLKAGAPGAQWAPGQFGVALQGGPGSIYVVDGNTRDVRLLANVMLDGVPNPGPGLGNIAFDADHRQVFAPDLYTGMIHRIGLDGADLGHFDHGVTARTGAQLPPVPFDAAQRMNITAPRFDVNNADTWGLAPPARRVNAATYYAQRLYYSVLDGPQIWSVGIDRTGEFLTDARLEAVVPPQPDVLPVTDIAFSREGAMLVAQRGNYGSGVYDYSAFTKPGEPRVLRFWLKSPNDPPSPGLWIAQPQEVPVGFAGNERNPNGGLAFGYGYDRTGQISAGACSASLLITGEKLRLAPNLQDRLIPGGPLPVDGLQISPFDVVRDPLNPQPWASYFVDYDDRYDDIPSSGRLGSVRTLAAPCAPALAGNFVNGLMGQVGGGGGNPTYVDGPHDGGCVGPNCYPCPYPNVIRPDGSCGPYVVTGIPVDLGIEKTGGTSPFWSVRDYAFTLKVTNNSAPFLAPGGVITVNDAPPPGMSFTGVSVVPAGWTCLPVVPGPAPFTCTWNGGPVPAGTIATISVTAIATGTAPFPPFTNCATVGIDPASGYQDSYPPNNQSCVTVTKPAQNVDVAVKKGGVLKPNPAGTGYTFTLAMTNVGPAFTGANVVSVTDIVPAGMTFTITATTGAPLWNCGPPRTITAGNPLTCTYIGAGPTAPGAPMGTIQFDAAASGNATYDNCATIGVTGLTDTDPSNNKSCATVGGVDLALAKTGAIVPVADMPVPGVTKIDYTLKVTNAGAAFNAANGVVTITDVVPANVTFDAVTAPAGWTCAPVPASSPATLTCTFAGGAVPTTFAANFVIHATAKGAGPFVNCGDVHVGAASGYQDYNPGNNHSCATVTPNGGGFDPVNPPPPVVRACGVNVIFVVDQSASMAPYAGSVIGALNNAASIMNTNGAKAALVRFSDNASVVQPMATATWPLLSAGYSPNGATNWQAAMTKALGLLPSPNTMIVFITDGEPTAYLDSSNNVVATTDSVLATNKAIPVVNSIYAAGVPILGIGVGNFSTHMNALLGGNVTMTTYGGLPGTLNALAQELCPSIYLTKSIGNNYINYHNNPGPHQVPVTLTLHNTAGPLTGVVVQDALPAELTTPGGYAATPGTATATGNIVNWTIGAMAANSTATLTFHVNVTPTSIPTDGSWHCINNYSQVTAVGGGVVNAIANNMTNPVTGPVHEPDEAQANVCVQDYVYVPTPCTTPQLHVTKSIASEVCRPSVPGGPVSSSPCTFTVTVQDVCAPFNGPVRFGEGIYSGSSSTTVAVPIASVTSVPPTPCAFGSTSPTSCTANVSLTPGNSITFTVTLGGPIAPGNYTNCFLADGKTPVPANYNAAYTDVNPTTSANGDPWGNCRPFIVAAPGVAPAGLLSSCPEGQVLVPGKGCERIITCRAPQIPNVAGTACVCPTGTVLRGDTCVKIDTVCKQPFVPNATGSCVCPMGAVQRGDACVKIDTVCKQPFVPNATGSCVCPMGAVQRGDTCVKQPVDCRKPFVANAAGACVCPPGTIQRGNSCVPQIVCRSPLQPNSAGTACVCPAGTVRKGNQCVQPVVCNAPAKLNARGECQCPAGYVANGKSCVRREQPRPAPVQRPGVTPGDVLQFVPGLLQGGGGGGGGGVLGGGGGKGR